MWLNSCPHNHYSHTICCPLPSKQDASEPLQHISQKSSIGHQLPLLDRWWPSCGPFGRRRNASLLSLSLQGVLTMTLQADHLVVITRRISRQRVRFHQYIENWFQAHWVRPCSCLFTDVVGCSFVPLLNVVAVVGVWTVLFRVRSNKALEAVPLNVALA